MKRGNCRVFREKWLTDKICVDRRRNGGSVELISHERSIDRRGKWYRSGYGLEKLMVF